MPNYNLVVTSKFQPLSYERYLQPYKEYQQAYARQEQGLSELESKAGMYEKMALAEEGSKTAKLYQTYANDLRNAAESLSKRGLSPDIRKSLIDLKSRYSKEITPIELAIKARDEEAKEQRAGKAQGMVYENEAAYSSLDRYLDNPSIRYSGANSSEGFKRLATAATALSKKLSDYGKGKNLDGYTRTWLQEHGYKDTDVETAISDIQEAVRGKQNYKGQDVLKELLWNEMVASGVDKWKDTNAQLEYYNKVAPALYQSVGGTQVGTYEDKAAMMAAEHAYQKDLIDYKYNKEHPDFDPNSIFGNQRDKSLLEATGDLKGYNTTMTNMYYKGNPKASYFGKDKKHFVSPLKVYNDYISNINKKMATKVALYGPSSGNLSVNEKEQIKKDIMKKYGVTKIITPTEAKHLTALGYTSNSTMNDFYKINNKIRQRGIEYTYSSVNLPDLNVPSRTIIANLAEYADLDNFDNVAWSVNKYGKQGKAIGNLEDMGIKDINKDVISDMHYGAQNPDKVWVTINGKSSLMNPYAISTQAGKLVQDANKLLSQTKDPDARNIIQKSTTAALRKLLEGWNPKAPLSSSN